MSASGKSSCEDHDYRPCPPTGCRSPCPALNALANHGYISREGYDLSFFALVDAIILVYNLSYPLAGLLALVGFLTCGRLSFGRGVDLSRGIHTKQFWPLLFFPLFLLVQLGAAFGPRFVLDLSSLSFRGGTKITHDASFVHPDGLSSTAPRPGLLGGLLDFAATRRELDGKPRDGLGLIDIAHFHVHRLQNASVTLNDMHSQIALGECALTWEVLRGHQCYDGPGQHDRSACVLKDRVDGVIPRSRLEQWFGQERLPDGWWDFEGIRPTATVGLIGTKVLANSIGSLARKSFCSSCTPADASS